MAADTFGVVVIGTGFGRRIHVPALRSAGVEIVALVGRDPDATARRAERAGVAHACTSLDDALRLPGADAVVVATPPSSHAPLAEQAIAAGRHVLVEKPFTVDAAEARRLEGSARQAGVVALVGHEFRFAPERVTMLDAIRRGAIGAPRLATFLSNTDIAVSDDVHGPPWWFDAAAGGGWLGAAVSHLVDAIRVWLGEFASVSATLPRLVDRGPSLEAEDTVNARFRLRSGCEGVLQSSAAVRGRGVQRMAIAGDAGVAEIDGGEVTLADAGGTRTLDPVGPPSPVPPPDPNDRRAFLSQIELGPATSQAMVFRDLVLGRASGGAVAPATFADGVACMEVLDAMRRSAAAGGALVDVP